MRKVADVVRTHFTAAGLPSTDPGEEFKPHVTLMKLSRAPVLRKQGIKKIDASLYEEQVDGDFGVESVGKIQLCSMTLPKDKETGYYFCAKIIDL